MYVTSPNLTQRGINAVLGPRRLHCAPPRQRRALRQRQITSVFMHGATAVRLPSRTGAVTKSTVPFVVGGRGPMNGRDSSLTALQSSEGVCENVSSTVMVSFKTASLRRVCSRFEAKPFDGRRQSPWRRAPCRG